MPITHLLLGGGGASGFEILGILHGFQWNGLSRSITHVSSISIGTLFAAFFMMDIDMVRVRQRIEAFSMDARNLYISAAEILRMPYTYALYDTEKLIEPVKEFMRQKWPDVPPDAMTHAEFCKRCRGRDWAIVMSNLHTSKPVVARPNNFGDVPVLDLVRASMALPLFMRPVPIHDMFYIDGGLCCDNPALAYAADPPPAEHVCAVIILAGSRSGSSSSTNPLQSIGHYLQSLFACGLWPKSAFVLPKTCGHTITIQETTMPLLPVRITNKGLWLDITPEKIETAFMKGLALYEAQAASLATQV